MLQEIPLDFSGGLHTTLNPAFIGDNECQQAANAIVFDGSVRLDRRYKSILDAPLANNGDGYTTTLVRGSGYGKYGGRPFTPNTQLEQYVMAFNGDLYLADLTSATLSWTKVAGSTYNPVFLTDWFFQQFQDYIYGVQPQYGFGRKKIGLGSNGTGDWQKLTNPITPASAPVVSVNAGGSVTPSLSGDTLTITPTPNTQNISATQVGCSYFSPQTGTVTFKITFTGPQDWTHLDTLVFRVNVPPLGAGMDTIWTDVQITDTVGGIKVIGPFWKEVDTNNKTLQTITVRLTDVARGNRGAVTDISFDFVCPGSTATGVQAITIDSISLHGVWLSLDTNAPLPVGNGNPLFTPLVYAYTYLNSTTGFESLPSPKTTVPASSQNPLGEWRTLTIPSSTESGVDKVNIYRVVTEADGSITYFQLAQVANGGTITYVDKDPLDVVEGDPIFNPFLIPTTNTQTIGAWQDRLILAVGAVLYISREGDPLKFTPLGTVEDVTDPARARTFYVDDDRSETIRGIIAQDALYIITDKSVRCLYGSGVDDWRLVKMPEIEGCRSNRGFYPYRNGVIVLTNSGRLMYINVSFPAPDEVSRKLHPRIGNPGLQQYHIIAVSPEGEIECRAEGGTYSIMDINGSWRRGHHTDRTHSILYIPNIPVRWIGMNGKMYEGGSDLYQDDDGVPVTWLVQGKVMKIPRNRVKEVYFSDTPQTLDVQDTTKALYPKVTIDGEGGPHSYVPFYGEKTCKISSESRGASISVQIEGDKDTVLVGAVMRIEEISRAANK